MVPTAAATVMGLVQGGAKEPVGRLLEHPEGAEKILVNQQEMSVTKIS